MSPAVHLIPPLMGVAAYLAIHNLWIWHGRRREPLHLWVSLWCANSLLYLISHYAQITSALPEQAVLGGRLAWTGAIVLIGVTIGLSHALVGVPWPRGLSWAVGILNAGLLLLLWLTGAIVSDRAYVRTDLLGYQYQAPMPGPLLPLLAPYILAVFAYAWRMLGRGEMDRAERQAIRAGFAVYIVLALNDMLHSARLIQSIRVFDLGFVAVGVGLTYMLVRRYNRLHASLQDQVDARTREIEARRAELSALVQSGQAVMGGLDLETTLQRIIAQARAITGSPHIKLLLVDREAGVLRMGALSGGAVPPGFQVPLGQSYSGTVAVTGQPLFVADTRTDPRNLLAQRDREQGIVTYLGLPVRKGDEVLGVLTINTEAPHEYSAEELAYLGSFADQAATAIDNARLYSAAAERERRLQALASLTTGLAATRPLDDLLDDVVRSASELLAPAAARLWLVDEGGETLSLRARAGDVSDVTGAVRFHMGQGMIGRIAASGEPLVVEDLESHAGRINVERHRAEGLVSFAGVPLTIGERTLGALGIASRQRRRFGAEDMSLLRVLADHAAMAIDGSRLFTAAQRQARELEALHDVRSAVVSTLDLQSVLETIGSSAKGLVKADGAAVFELDPRAGLLRPRTTYGWRADVMPLPVRLGQGAAGAAALRREPVWSEDIRAQPLPGYDEAAPGTDRPLGEAVKERSYRGILGVPLLSRDAVFGALCLYWVEPHAPDQGEISLATAVAQQAAVALENARLYRSAERRVERLEALTHLSRALSSSLDRNAILKAITASAAQLMRVRGASFWLADERARVLSLVGFSDPEMEASFPARVMAIDQGLLGWIVTHRRLVNVADVFTDERFLHPAWWRAHGIKSFVGMPVVHGDSIVGVLALVNAQPFLLDAEDEAILGAFAAQAAVAVKNASLYEGARDQAREIGALHEVGSALVSTLDLDSVLGAIVSSAMGLTGAGGASVFELEPEGDLLRLRVSRGIDESRTAKALRLGQGAAGAAAARREAVWSPDVAVQPLPGYGEVVPGSGKPLGDAVRDLAYRGLLGVPLLSRDAVLGAICLYWFDAHAPEEQEIRLLTAFARQAAVALDNARLHAALGRRLGRVEALARLARALSSSLDRERILGEIARAAAELAQARFVSIWLADEATRTLTLGGVSDPEIDADWATTALSFGQSGVGWIAAHRRALRVDDSFADARFLRPEWRRKHGLKAFLGLPVIHEGRLVGVLSLSGPEALSREPEDEALLSAFTAQAAMAVHNASLYEAEGQARREAELALAQVKQLHGLLPICAYCKKIRDDSNYWQSIEAYIGQRSAATFSHGICPDCKEKIVKPEMERWKREMGRGGQP